MDMYKFSEINKNRCEKGFKHKIEDWDTNKWMVATLGELGEAANILKKMNRLSGTAGHANKEMDKDLIDLIKRFRSELADTFIYLDLLSQAAGINLPSAVADTFNNKSKELGLTDPEFFV